VKLPLCCAFLDIAVISIYYIHLLLSVTFSNFDTMKVNYYIW
jgi:hypothetical protein